MNSDHILTSINISKRRIEQCNSRIMRQSVFDHKASLDKILQKEEEILQYYKDEYPEYFL